jgi:phage repressor protein C with HTH and peptisase S24 domain
MPVSAPVPTLAATYSLIEAELRGELQTIGVLLHDPASDGLHLRLRRDWDRIAGGENDVLELLAEDLESKAREMGAEALLQSLEDTLSNTLRVTERRPVMVEDFDRALNRLYRRHVPATIEAFRTHLPLYSLRAAAGRFLENSEVSEEAWIEIPADVRGRLNERMFVAHIQGHSMEPRIPDGSLCLFEAGLAGSRQGRLVLVEDPASSGYGRYSIKRYQSVKSASSEGWRHERIRLESLNPEYPSWDLDAEGERYRIVGVFVGVIE